MDRYTGLARLEWWANRSTCLGSVDVNLVVVADGEDWRVSATFVAALGGEDRDGWSFLMELDPHFTLRFLEDQEATILVRVEESETDRLHLSAA